MRECRMHPMSSQRIGVLRSAHISSPSPPPFDPPSGHSPLEPFSPPPSALTPPPSPSAALVEGLAISRSGDFTCPVRCGAVFLGTLPAASATRDAPASSSSASASVPTWGGAPSSFPASAASSSQQHAPPLRTSALTKHWEQWSLVEGGAGAGGREEREQTAVSVVTAWTQGCAVSRAVDGVHEVSELLEKVGHGGLFPLGLILNRRVVDTHRGGLFLVGAPPPFSHQRAESIPSPSSSPLVVGPLPSPYEVAESTLLLAHPPPPQLLNIAG